MCNLFVWPWKMKWCVHIHSCDLWKWICVEVNMCLSLFMTVHKQLCAHLAVCWKVALSRPMALRQVLLWRTFLVASKTPHQRRQCRNKPSKADLDWADSNFTSKEEAVTDCLYVCPVCRRPCCRDNSLIAHMHKAHQRDITDGELLCFCCMILTFFGGGGGMGAQQQIWLLGMKLESCLVFLWGTEEFTGNFQVVKSSVVPKWSSRLRDRWLWWTLSKAHLTSTLSVRCLDFDQLYQDGLWRTFHSERNLFKE